MHRIRSETITVRGLAVHYFRAGQGEPLIIIHGGGDGARAWRRTMVELSRQYTVYVPDLPGFGRSQELNGNYYIPELVDFVEEFSHNLGLEKFYLIGHSLGGGIALNYALKSPNKVRKLVLVSSLFLGKEIALWVRLLTASRIGRYLGEGIHALLRGIKWLVDCAINPVIRVEFINPVSAASIHLSSKLVTFKQQATVLANRLGEITVPTLVIWGAKDGVLPVSHAYAAAKLIPDCQIKIFQNSGHSVYRAIGFAALLIAFLR